MTSIDIGELEVTYPGLASPIDVVSSVEATLRLLNSRGEAIFEEQSFPVVELAGALKKWMAVQPEIRDNFEFDSMDYEEPGLLWCRREGSKWRVGSILQRFPDLELYDTETIEQAFKLFIDNLEKASKIELDLDLTPVWRFLLST